MKKQKNMPIIFNPDVAHIVYASDDKFAEILGISMVSLYENNKDMVNIIVYIMDSGISVSNKKRINSVSGLYNRPSPIWIKAKDISKELNIKVNIDRGSLSQYSRLFISSLLPENLGRVLYLDCDIIINKTINELWNLDLHGKTIAALEDAFSRYYRININLHTNDIMFNSGVMLIDIKKWKKQKIESKLLEFIISKKGRIQQGDQGALNAVLSHNVYCFEPKYNAVTIFYDFTYDEMLSYRKPPDFYPEIQVREAVENPVLIHFTTSFLSKRPWIKGCQHKYVNEWIKYKKKSPWKEEDFFEDKTSILEKTYIKILDIVPRKLVLWAAGILQAYIRPIKNLIGGFIRGKNR